MNIIAKHVTIVALGAASTFLAGSAFVPGTAEAHCGGHSFTCQTTQGIWMGYVCIDGYLYSDYRYNEGYCMTPAPGCSGAACANWPCADDQCTPGWAESCNYWEDYEFVTTEC